MAEQLADLPLDRLLARLVDQQATTDEIGALESILTRDPAARCRYVHYLDLHQELRDRVGLDRPPAWSPRIAAPPLELPRADDGAEPTGIVGALASVGRLWPRVAAAWGDSSPQMRAVVVATALSLYFVGLLIAVVAHRAFQAPHDAERGAQVQVPIAQLLEPVGCVWKIVGAVQPDSTVVAGEALELVRGVAKFRFNNGVNVTAVGPCALEFISPGRLRMERGKLLARVPRQAIGFIVEAEQIEIVDLGTEFGVEVDELGQAEVHMIEGAAEVRPRSANDGSNLPPPRRPVGHAVRLVAGQAIRVSQAGAISNIASDSGRFAGATDKQPEPAALGNKDRLDVVDLLCGGDGTSRKRGLAIDPATGQFGTLPFANRTSDGKYHPTPNHRVLDGCFMPDSVTQIDSAGHQFEFPPTSAYTWDHIRAGGELFGTVPGQIASKLGDVDFGQPPHGFLLLLSNAGLTLDLASIRRSSKQRIHGFRAIVGNSDIVDRVPKADFFVIVDGKARFERRGFTIKDTPFDVYVPLEPSDGFLTLATSDGGDRAGGDWIGLGDPVLEVRNP